MATETSKKFVEQYITLTTWFLVHQDDKKISKEQFEVVLQEIGKVEEGLRKNGVLESAIQKLIGCSKELYETPIDQLPPNTQFRIFKIIFGDKTRLAGEKGKNDSFN